MAILIGGLQAIRPFADFKDGEPQSGYDVADMLGGPGLGVHVHFIRVLAGEEVQQCLAGMRGAREVIGLTVLSKIRDRD